MFLFVNKWKTTVHGWGMLVHASILLYNKPNTSWFLIYQVSCHGSHFLISSAELITQLRLSHGTCICHLSVCQQFTFLASSQKPPARFSSNLLGCRGLHWVGLYLVCSLSGVVIIFWFFINYLQIFGENLFKSSPKPLAGFSSTMVGMYLVHSRLWYFVASKCLIGWGERNLEDFTFGNFQGLISGVLLPLL